MRIYQIYFNSLWEGTFNSFNEAVDDIVKALNFLVSCSMCEPITIVEFIK